MEGLLATHALVAVRDELVHVLVARGAQVIFGYAGYFSERVADECEAHVGFSPLQVVGVDLGLGGVFDDRRGLGYEVCGWIAVPSSQVQTCKRGYC